MFKRILILMLPLAFVTAAMAQGQSSKQVEGSFIGALGKADADAMASLFFSSVDLSLPEEEGTFSKTQASMILRTFFKANPPGGFEVKQSGTSNDGSRFTIGNYKSSNGSVYRVLFLVKKIGADYKVHLLEIELEE